MTKNPFLNAIIALAYITLIACFMFYGTRALGPERGVIIPITMLSIFVFSAAFMGLTFFYHPARMYLDGAKKEAADLIGKTVATFAVITVFLVIILALLGR